LSSDELLLTYECLKHKKNKQSFPLLETCVLTKKNWIQTTRNYYFVYIEIICIVLLFNRLLERMSKKSVNNNFIDQAMHHNSFCVTYTKNYEPIMKDLMLDTVKTWTLAEECHLLGASWQN